jgi:hypothetical protein
MESSYRTEGVSHHLGWAAGQDDFGRKTFPGSVAPPFVIPSAAEGSAVPRTSPGNVFRPERSVAESSAVLPPDIQAGDPAALG